MVQHKLHNLVTQSFILTSSHHREITYKTALTAILNGSTITVLTMSNDQLQILLENIIYAIKNLTLPNAILACTVLGRIQNMLNLQPDLLIPARDTTHVADDKTIYEYLDAILCTKSIKNIPNGIQGAVAVSVIYRRYALQYNLEQIAICLRNNAFVLDGTEEKAIQAIHDLKQQKFAWFFLNSTSNKLVKEICELLTQNAHHYMEEK